MAVLHASAKHPAVTPLSHPSLAGAHFTVIVPAHNEEGVIAGTLRAMLAGWPEKGEPHVIVVCNGCADATAACARAAAPCADVVEIAAASKTEAINEGLARTHDFPVIVVDADIHISAASLAALADALREPGVMAASPAPQIDTSASDWPTRAYYRVWQAHPYLATGVGGSGVYGLSEAGARRIGRFPPVIADDSFVRCSFPLAQQRRVRERQEGTVFSQFVAPAGIMSLLACEARWQAGNVQLRSIMPEPDPALGDHSPPSAGPRPTDRLIHMGIKIAGRALYLYYRLRSRHGRWHRGPRGGTADAPADPLKNPVEKSIQ